MIRSLLACALLSACQLDTTHQVPVDAWPAIDESTEYCYDPTHAPDDLCPADRVCVVASEATEYDVCARPCDTNSQCPAFCCTSLTDSDLKVCAPPDFCAGQASARLKYAPGR